jgi:hypothetical protein
VYSVLLDRDGRHGDSPLLRAYEHDRGPTHNSWALPAHNANATSAVCSTVGAPRAFQPKPTPTSLPFLIHTDHSRFSSLRRPFAPPPRCGLLQLTPPVQLPRHGAPRRLPRGGLLPAARSHQTPCTAPRFGSPASSKPLPCPAQQNSSL